MVGVAGKSKGCNTCRRRKIRCSEEKPHCLKCIRSGRTCEGYERYPVFLNRSAEGIHRRRPLEEVKPESSTAAAAAASASGTPEPDQGLQTAVHRTSVSPPVQTVAASPATWSTGFISWFWHSYSPASASASRPAKDLLWLHHALQITHPSRMLHQTLLALSMVRLGRVNKSETLVREGQDIYGHGIRSLQAALYDPMSAWQDETLAAVRAMVLYELFETTSNTSFSWHNHVAGLRQLIVSRGPSSYGTPLARAVFEEFRYPLMIDSIMLRKASPLASPIWRTEPWADTTKDADQILYDHGFTTAVVLDNCDTLAEALTQEPDNSSLDLLVAIIRSTLRLNSALDDFFSTHLTDSTLLFLTRGGRVPSPTQSGPIIDPSNFHAEIQILTWWAIKLLIANVAQGLVATTQKFFVTALQSDEHNLQDLSVAVEALTDAEICNEMARRVLDSVPLFLNERVGRFGTSRAIFPLSAAMLQFLGSKEELARCVDLSKQIGGGKGFMFAKGVSLKNLPIPLISRPQANGMGR